MGAEAEKSISHVEKDDQFFIDQNKPGVYVEFWLVEQYETTFPLYDLLSEDKKQWLQQKFELEEFDDDKDVASQLGMMDEEEYPEIVDKLKSWGLEVKPKKR